MDTAEPKPNEIWVTKAGNLCMCVCKGDSQASGAADWDNNPLQFIWFDPIDNEYTVSEIYARLDRRATAKERSQFVKAFQRIAN